MFDHQKHFGVNNIAEEKENLYIYIFFRRLWDKCQVTGAGIQMRLKDPFSLKTAEMTKRSSKPKKPREEESSDEVSGLTCQHVSKAVELNSVKKAVTGSLWSVCSDCMRERDVFESEPDGAHDILVCLKCGFQVIY
ncbi:hypothetical protein PDJAM_G00121790 [Pangasius djambal]|uniref:Uncharacterized protein n=1 Tax=Pangasius djambal TaxID=1691987 RepID=A0ACC5ZAW2_9TELE|nr:hypothetical protein [Pangasius djambal]